MERTEGKAEGWHPGHTALQFVLSLPPKISPSHAMLSGMAAGFVNVLFVVICMCMYVSVCARMCACLCLDPCAHESTHSGARV